METQELLKKIGISSDILLVITMIAAGFYVYKNYHETVLTKLRIKELEERVGPLQINSSNQ